VDEDQIERPEAAVLYLAASSQTGECSRERLFEAHRPLGGSPPPDDPKTAMPSFQKWGRTPLSASPRFFFGQDHPIPTCRIYCSWYRTSPVSRYPGFAGVKETIHEMGDSKLGSSL